MLPTWVVESSHAHDFLDDVFPSNEAIIEAMSGVEPPWEELHHRSYFLCKLDCMERDEFRDILMDPSMDKTTNPMGTGINNLVTLLIMDL